MLLSQNILHIRRQQIRLIRRITVKSRHPSLSLISPVDYKL
jgi:hypothetical protein